MAELPLEVRLSGQEADFHELPAYDGFNSMAGISLAATIVTHYAATGNLRRRGQFETRSRIRFKESRRGSIIFGLAIELASNPYILGATGGVAVSVAGSAVYDLLKYVIQKNIGREHAPQTKALENLLESREGDVEAVTAAIEPALRQGHSVIGTGASTAEITGKNQDPIATFDRNTKDYISRSIEDETIIEKDVSIAAFNANSGHGRLFDDEHGRTVSFYIPEHAQSALKSVIGWGLSEYTRGTGRRISTKFTRILALDGRPKKYIILDAEIPQH